MYGRFHAVEPKPRLRPVRNHPPHASRPTTRVPVPPAEWVAVPVPALIDPAIAAAARAQLAENRRRKREQCRGPGWLLQGLVVCRRCGYAYYGKATPGLAERHRPGPFGYGAYRCIGSDGHRFDGQAVCSNRPVRSDHLERAVWAEIEACGRYAVTESFYDDAFVYAGKGHPELAGADLVATYVPSSYDDLPPSIGDAYYHPFFARLTFP